MKSFLAILFIGICCQSQAQTIVVRENFYNTVANGYRTGSAHGWALTLGTTDTAARGAINAPSVGSTLTDNTPIGVNYSTNTDTGFYQNTESANIKLFYTSKAVSIDRTMQELSKISWVSANNSNLWNMQPVLQIAGTNWFVYNNTSIQDSANSASDGAAFTNTKVYYWEIPLDMNAANWYPLTHQVNAALSVSTTPQVLPVGNVTGYGLLYTRPTNSSLSTRWDTYQITVTSKNQRRAIMVE